MFDLSGTCLHESCILFSKGQVTSMIMTCFCSSLVITRSGFRDEVFSMAARRLTVMVPFELGIALASRIRISPCLNVAVLRWRLQWFMTWGSVSFA